MSDAWRVSLHGGHSGGYCEHAVGDLEEIVAAAVAAGYAVFGLSEHAPRSESRFLYPSEREKGYDVARLEREFELYAERSRLLIDQFEGRLTLLRGFEAEVVPTESYRRQMFDLRRRHGFDYMVGSVHYVEDIQLDGLPEEYEEAVRVCGGLEGLAVRYYEKVAEMAQALRPEIIGHLDLIRRNAPPDAALDTAAIRGAADQALEAIRSVGAILDLNTAGYRKGLGSPYPAPWLVERAHSMGIGFCFGDDSHRVEQVGAGVDQARQYLLELGVREIEFLTRRDGEIVRQRAPL